MWPVTESKIMAVGMECHGRIVCNTKRDIQREIGKLGIYQDT